VLLTPQKTLICKFPTIWIDLSETLNYDNELMMRMLLEREKDRTYINTLHKSTELDCYIKQ